MIPPLAVLSATTFRRYVALALLLTLGVMLIYVALARPPEGLFWRAFLLLVGGGVLYLAEKFRRATLLTIELFEGELRDSSGTVLCRLDEIETINRGTFAIKPSNGFLLRLNTQRPRVWRPGLWWRIGRRVGVGGVTASNATRFMAETIELSRDGGK
ncbi:hypothetical protein [Brevirhabdus sp.]|uniref:hypothetical protein n=1 Tax=Brevirhabdus sp. TaxID=2004514 RepID=UPI0040591D24